MRKLMDLKNYGIYPGKSLPYDAEIEYLESDGNGECDGPYIDTGIYPRNNPSAIIRCQYLGTNLSVATTPLFGSREYRAYSDGGMCSFGFWIRSDTMKLAINYDKTDTGWLSQMTDTTSFHDFKLSNEGSYYDGVQIYTTELSIGTVPRKTVFIFAINQINYYTGLIEHITRGVKLRVASFQLFTDGVLSWDGICVRKNGIGYMYDKVSGQLFGNQGSGNFILGPDKKNVSLPYDSEIEYLESTGTQWIDTGVLSSQSLRVKSRFYGKGAASQFVYGVRAGSATITCATESYGSLGWARWGSDAFASAIPQGDVTVDQSASAITANGLVYPYSAAQTVVPQDGYTLVMFAARNGTASVTTNLSGEIFYLQIYDNNILVRDFIPVRVGQVGAMYDRRGVGGMNSNGTLRTDGLYFNQGTGNFILGPDKKNVSLPYNSEVEYIQANGIAYIDTGVPFTTNYTARCKFQFVSSSSETLSPFGFWFNQQYASRMYWRGGSSDWRYQHPTTNPTVFASSSAIPFGDIHELEIGPSQVAMDGISVSVVSSSFTDVRYTQSLFGSSSYNPIDHPGTKEAYKHELQSASSIIRIYSASWADETGTIIRDFIPVRIGRIGAMYDRANPFGGPNGNGLYFSETDPLIPGPDKS